MNLLSLFFEQPWVFFAIILVFLVALSVHEASHAFMGVWLGDPTAERLKRLTLNPLAHVDPLGFLALITVGFGWGKPVPFNPYNLRYRRWGPAFVAAAGPLANLVLGSACALAYRYVAPALGQFNLLSFFLFYSAYLNFLLMFFNLIPIPPLDGSKALLAALADERYRNARLFIETQGPMILIGLILISAFTGLNLFGWLVQLANGLFRLIAG
jgi:Zn-dependent protease